MTSSIIEMAGKCLRLSLFHVLVDFSNKHENKIGWIILNRLYRRYNFGRVGVGRGGKGCYGGTVIGWPSGHWYRCHGQVLLLGLLHTRHLPPHLRHVSPPHTPTCIPTPTTKQHGTQALLNVALRQVKPTTTTTTHLHHPPSSTTSAITITSRLQPLKLPPLTSIRSSIYGYIFSLS